MEVKQIEACIGDWLCVVNSLMTKGHFQHFFPRIFPKHFSKVVFIIILKAQIFVNFRITVKKGLIALGKQEDNEENH